MPANLYSRWKAILCYSLHSRILLYSYVINVRKISSQNSCKCHILCSTATSCEYNPLIFRPCKLLFNSRQYVPLFRAVRFFEGRFEEEAFSNAIAEESIEKIDEKLKCWTFSPYLCKPIWGNIRSRSNRWSPGVPRVVCGRNRSTGSASSSPYRGGSRFAKKQGTSEQSLPHGLHTKSEMQNFSCSPWLHFQKGAVIKQRTLFFHLVQYFTLN